ncbi:MAG: Insulinase (Peptidase M16) [Chaenotheca gracillima]|nr:MAG: Insulinase (Peptidase M16) [Chaenotheca gracillima]
MLSTARSRWSLVSARRFQLAARRSYGTKDPIPTNDPNPPRDVQNVSGTNAVPTSAAGNRDAPLQEHPEDSEKQRVMQAPNRKEVWSRSQQPRSKGMAGPRFEQTIMEYQAHEHHREYLESLPSTTYPLTAQGDAAEVPESQRITEEPLGQR